MAGRPRTPTAVLDARGAFKKDPQRRRDGEPVVREPLGAMPDNFDEGQARAWTEITETAPLGVLTEADRLAVEFAATLLAEFRQDRYGFPATKHGTLLKLLGQFGMTPSERSRLSIPKAKERENPFAALDQ